MIIPYAECIKNFGSPYQIRKAVKKGEIYCIRKGWYSDKAHESELALMMAQYSKSVLTMRNAFYYYGLTDVIPDKYDLATDRNAAKIRDKLVKQYFYPTSFFKQGITEMDYQGTNIRIYDKERMLIELLRYKTKLPFDYYKELISSYRKILENLDIEKIESYAADAPNSNKVVETLQAEVF